MFLCIFITMHIHYYAYSLTCIFITMHIHYYAYLLPCIFITMHIHYYAYSFTYIFTSLCIFTAWQRPVLYKLLPQLLKGNTDRYTQLYGYIDTLTEDTTGPNRGGTWLQIISDSTINSVKVNSLVVVSSHIAKQHFTRLHCDSSK